MNIAEMCRVLAMTLICCIWSLGPMEEFLWCMQCMWMALHFVQGSILSFGRISNFVYMTMSTLKCVMTCESKRGPLWGLKL